MKMRFTIESAFRHVNYKNIKFQGALQLRYKLEYKAHFCSCSSNCKSNSIYFWSCSKSDLLVVVFVSIMYMLHSSCYMECKMSFHNPI